MSKISAWMGKSLAFLVVFMAVFSVLGSAAVAEDTADWIVSSHLDRYFQIPQTARVVGMGGSSWVTSSDISSIAGNPAGLGFVTRPELGLTYSHGWYTGDEQVPSFLVNKAPGFDDVGAKAKKNAGGLQLICPCCRSCCSSCGVGGGCNVCGGSGSCWSGGRGVLGFDGWYDDTGFSDFGGTDGNRYRLTAAYGYALNDCFSLGYSLSYFNDDISSNHWDYTLDDGLRHSAGAQLRLGDCGVLGLNSYFAYGNPEVSSPGLGTDEGDLDSWGIELGYACQVLPQTLFATSIDYTEDQFDGVFYAMDQEELRNIDEEISGWGFHLGVEQNYNDMFLPRLGYRYQDWDYSNETQGEFFHGSEDYVSSYHAISTGIGWIYNENLTLDYGVEYRFLGDGDVNNTITAKFHF
jgi:long-subunit fatty acid transport protein